LIVNFIKKNKNAGLVDNGGILKNLQLKCILHHIIH